MIILLFLLLAATPKIQINLELRHEGFAGKSRPVQGFKNAERRKDVNKLLKKLCGNCEITEKRGDYRMIFTVNHRPYGELSELIWEIRDRDNNELGRGWAFTAHKAVSDAFAVVQQTLKRRQS